MALKLYPNISRLHHNLQYTSQYFFNLLANTSLMSRVVDKQIKNHYIFGQKPQYWYIGTIVGMSIGNSTNTNKMRFLIKKKTNCNADVKNIWLKVSVRTSRKAWWVLKIASFHCNWTFKMSLMTCVI